MANKDKNSKEKGFSSFINSLVIAFVIAMFLRTFFVGAYQIPSGSMLDTLQLGDYLLASKLSYRIGSPQFGDIAIFEYPLEPRLDYIKRVIGVPGDEIEIINKQIYRNGVALEEPYVRKGFGMNAHVDFVKKFTVPDGQYLMLGDNRDQSFDSRYWGFVAEDAFKAKAYIIYWSKDPDKSLFEKDGIRWGRLFMRTK